MNSPKSRKRRKKEERRNPNTAKKRRYRENVRQDPVGYEEQKRKDRQKKTAKSRHQKK